MEALFALGLEPNVPVDANDLADPAVRARWIEEKHMAVLSLRHPDDALRRVDVFVDEPVAFSSLWESSVHIPLGSTSVRVASIPDLIAMKRMAGRAMDLEDVAALEQILQEKNDV